MNHYPNVPPSIRQLSTLCESPHSGDGSGTSRDDLSAVASASRVSDFYVRSDSRPLSKRSRLIRLFIFLLLELGYLALAFICYRKPLLLPSFLNFSELKGTLTIILIAWQTLATIPVSEIVLHVFSGEWSVRLSSTGHLVPGITDKVSTLTASIRDRAAHLTAGVASAPFIMAYLVSAALMGLAGVAPGTFSSSSVLANQTIALAIGNFTTTPLSIPSGPDPGMFLLQRAERITRLEQIDGSPFGYDVQSNWIVGWPPSNLEGVSGTVQYPSDGVRYQYECVWEAPVVHWAGPEATWVTKQTAWVLWPNIETLPPRGYSTLLLPLFPQSDHNNTRSAYLFLGSNSSLPYSGALGSSPIDLDGIPATYNASGYVFGGTGRNPDLGAPALASVLECDPRMYMSSVTVVRETNHTLRILSPDPASSERIGNIPNGATTAFFSQALLSASSTPEPFSNPLVLINYISASLFMTTYPPYAKGAQPLDLPTINANLDAYMSSAAKAYAGGYVPGDTLPMGSFRTLLVNGTVQVERLALAASKPLIITTAALVWVAAVFLGALILRGEEGRELFNLGSIIREMQRRYLDMQT